MPTGTYIIDANNAAEPADSRYVADMPAELRAIKTKLLTRKSVKDYKAAGDGVTDDTVKIQNALTEAAAAGVALYFPAGVYLITSPLNVTLSGDTPLVLIGEGSSGLSELRMNTGGNGLNITLLGNWWQGLIGANSTGIRISDMSFTTTNANVGTGINIVGACVTGRPSPQLIFDHCDFKAAASMSQYWGIAVDVLDAGECWFDACRFLIGGTANTTGVGVSLRGTAQANSPVHFYFDNCDFTYGGRQIEIGDYIEGVYISQCNMIAGDVGVYWHAVAGESGLHIVGGHFSHRSIALDLSNIFDFEVVGALIYRGSVAYAYTGISMETCGRFSITGNVFVGLDDATLAETGVYALSTPNVEKYGGVISSNSFHAFASRAIWLGVNANYVHVGDNLYRLCALRVLNQQGQYNNTVKGAQFAGNRVLTLTGGATSEVIDIPIPAGVFRSKPGGGIVSGSGNASALIGSYDYDSVSSTDVNARCTLRLINGGVISSGSNRVSYIFFEDEDTSL